MFPLLVFVLGLCVGSFLNVLIYRLPRGEGIGGRSYCDNCKKKLRLRDLFPLFSFVLLKGRCRECKEKIDPIIPLVELLTGFLFTAVFLKFPAFSPPSLLFLILLLITVSAFIVIFLIDAKNGIIPDKILYPTIFLNLILAFLDRKLIENLTAGFFSFLLLFSLYIITKKRGMGLGDVKLAFLLGLFLGFPKIVFSLYLAFLTGAIYSLILILWGKKKFRGDSIAFGPFLILGAMLSFFLGDRMASLLSNFL